MLPPGWRRASVSSRPRCRRSSCGRCSHGAGDVGPALVPVSRTAGRAVRQRPADTCSAVLLLETLVGAVDQIDVRGHVLTLELLDVRIPFTEVALPRDEGEGVLLRVVGERGLVQTCLLLLVLVHRSGEIGRAHV